MAVTIASTTARTCWAGVWEITTPVRRSMNVITCTPSERCEHSTPTFLAEGSTLDGAAARPLARSPAATAGGTARTGPDWGKVDRESMASTRRERGRPRLSRPRSSRQELAPQELQHLLRRLVGLGQHGRTGLGEDLAPGEGHHLLG